MRSFGQQKKTLSSSLSIFVLRQLNKRPRATIATRETLERKFLHSFNSAITIACKSLFRACGDVSAICTIVCIPSTLPVLKLQ